MKGTAFLTGAASGIGKATAFAFAKHGIKAISLTDMNRKNLLATTKELRTAFPDVQIEAIELDVTDNTAVENSILKTVERFGRIDVGFNNAGITGNGKMSHDGAVEDFLDVVDVNLNGVFRCHRALLKAMMVQEDLGPRVGRGAIVNMASMFGLAATPANVASTPYSAAKHGVMGLTKADAIIYAAHGIRINAICPGYVNTPLLADIAAAGGMDPEIAKTPINRMATPDEIAESVVFLASPMASFMVGSGLLVDGGYTASSTRSSA